MYCRINIVNEMFICYKIIFNHKYYYLLDDHNLSECIFRITHVVNLM